VDPSKEGNSDKAPRKRQFEWRRSTILIVGHALAASNKGVQIELGIAIEEIDESKAAAPLMELASLLLGWVGWALLALHDIGADGNPRPLANITCSPEGALSKAAVLVRAASRIATQPLVPGPGPKSFDAISLS